MILTNDQKKYIKDKIRGSIVIKDKTYYFKPVKTNNYAYLELVLEKLAKFINMNTAHYDLINIDGRYYYLSEELKNFRTSNVLKISDINLYEIWSCLENKYGEYTENIMYEIVKMYIFDLLLLAPDRHSCNWGIIDNNLYIIDNENSFCTTSCSSISSKHSIFDKLNNHFNPSFYINTIIENNLEELEYFLATSSQEFIELFYEIYDKLNPFVIKSVFNNIELEYNIDIPFKDSNLNLYIDYYTLIGELLNTRGLK